MRGVWKKLQNPFVLVGQGFVIGSLLLWAAQGEAKLRPVHPASVSILHSF